MNKEINKAMTQGIVFKKAKGEATDPSGKKIKFSDFLKGTHGNFKLSVLNYCVSLRMN